MLDDRLSLLQTVLVVDHNAHLWCDLIERSLRLQAISALHEYQDVYQAGALLQSRIVDITECQPVDWIVLGNNLGAGEIYAECIPPMLRARTLVVWNFYRLGYEISYLEQGFCWFANRWDILDELEKVTPQPREDG